MSHYKIFFGGILLCCSFFLATFLESAAAYRVQDTGSPSNGVAGAGLAAVARDASTAGFNPAGMTRLKRDQFMLAMQPLIISVRWHIDDATTFNGNTGGNVGSVALGVTTYLVHAVTDKLKVGFSTFTPGAISDNHGRDWKGRFFIQRNLFASLTGNFSVGYQLLPTFSVGAGLSIVYGYFNSAFAIPDENGVTTLPNQNRIKLNFDNHDNLAYGYNLGLLYEMSPCSRFGLTYTSKFDFRLRGRVDIVTTNGTTFTHGRTSIPLPQYVVASVYHQYSPCLALLANLSWDSWSILKKTTLKIHDQDPTEITRNWYDTWAIAIGAEYQILKPLTLQAGLSYDSSPVSKKFALPDLNFRNRMNASIGAIHKPNPSEQLSFGLTYSTSIPRRKTYDQTLFGNRFKANAPSDLIVIGFSYNREFGCPSRRYR